MQNVPVRIAKGLSRAVTRFPKATVMLFLAVAVVAASFVPGLRLYLSFYQLIPPDYHAGDEYTADCYGHYTELNRDFGGDNPWSDITWAAQTARILLASVAAILACAILVLPCLFYWDARRNPKAYGAPARRPGPVQRPL